MIILHSLVSLGYWNPRWATTAQSSKSLMGCFHGRAFSSAQPEHPERGSKWPWCLPEPRAAAEPHQHWWSFSCQNVRMPWGWQRAGVPRGWLPAGMFVLLRTLLCSVAGAAGESGLCAVGAGSGSRRAGLGTEGSGCPCSGTGHSAPSGCCHAVWPRLASPSTAPANRRPLGLGVCLAGLQAAFFFWSKWLWLSHSRCLKKSYYFYFLSSLCLSLTDLNNSKAPI